MPKMISPMLNFLERLFARHSSRPTLKLSRSDGWALVAAIHHKMKTLVGDLPELTRHLEIINSLEKQLGRPGGASIKSQSSLERAQRSVEHLIKTMSVDETMGGPSNEIDAILYFGYSSFGDLIPLNDRLLSCLQHEKEH